MSNTLRISSSPTNAVRAAITAVRPVPTQNRT